MKIFCSFINYENLQIHTLANSFSISVARITNGPLTAYSMALTLGLMFASVTTVERTTVVVDMLRWNEDKLEADVNKQPAEYNKKEK